MKANFDPHGACTVATLRQQAPVSSVEQRGHSEEEAGEEPADANDSGIVHNEAPPQGATSYQKEHYRNIAER